MSIRRIVAGQRVAPEKVAAARELRRHMTPEECILWEHLRAHRLNGLHFRRQQVIDGFVVDFYCSGCALVVERAISDPTKIIFPVSPALAPDSMREVVIAVPVGGERYALWRLTLAEDAYPVFRRDIAMHLRSRFAPP